MTERCMKSISPDLGSFSPDGLTGMIFAAEGMRDTIVLLNGPMGCRFYHSSTSGFLMRHPLLYLPSKDGIRRQVNYDYLNDWFFRQDRVPCTTLDGYDYVYGAKEKVREALTYIRENIAFSMLVIVNSPGAALIGDPLLTIGREVLGRRKVVMLESPGYSTSFEEGYAEALYAILSQVGDALWKERGAAGHPVWEQPVAEKTAPTVNLLGLSIWHRYCEGDRAEITRLLETCGIRVQSALCADCTLEELAAMPDADLNIVLYPEMGLAAAKYLKDRFGTPYYVPESLPIGFSAAEAFCKEISRLLGTSCEAVMDESGRARAIAYKKIEGIFQMYGIPKGVPFAVCGNPSQEKAYTAFLSKYLGMRPTEWSEAEVLLADANRIAEKMAENTTFCGIEIAQPTIGYVDLTVKTHMGIQGAMFLIEQILNGVMSRI